MAQQTWQTLVNAYTYSGTQTGATLENSETLTDISPGAGVTGQALTIPAGYIVAGHIIRYTARGWFSTTSEPTITLGLYWGTVSGTALAKTRAMTTPSSVTELPWALEATTRITAAGESGKAITQGQVAGIMKPAETSTAGVTLCFLPESKPQTEVAINTSVANAVTLGAKWGTKSASNKIAVTHWLVEILN